MTNFVRSMPKFTPGTMNFFSLTLPLLLIATLSTIFVKSSSMTLRDGDIQSLLDDEDVKNLINSSRPKSHNPCSHALYALIWTVIHCAAHAVLFGLIYSAYNELSRRNMLIFGLSVAGSIIILLALYYINYSTIRKC